MIKKGGKEKSQKEKAWKEKRRDSSKR